MKLHTILVLLSAAIGHRAALAAASSSHPSLPLGGELAIHDRMLYDAPGDGSLWTRGASYKARFDSSGATYYPYFGPSAPHDYAHSLSPDRVTVGGIPLAFERSASAVRDGDHVALNRGAFVESYDVALDSVEQTFVFDSLPRGGDLMVHIPVASELDASASVDGIEFRSELGRVVYGRATAVDARGRRAELATELEDGAITWRVDAGFLASATFPLVVDPLVTTIFFPSSPNNDDFSADVTSETLTAGWLVVWEERFSSTDSDVYCKYFDSAGQSVANATIDFTTTTWTRPRCAELSNWETFLVVAGSVNGTTHYVSGRTVQILSPLSLGGQFEASGSELGDKLAPDIGGDPNSIILTFSSVCLVYQHNIPSGGSEIVACTYEHDLFDNGIHLINEIAIPTSTATPDLEPSIAKSNGVDQWLVAWERVTSGLGHISAAHIDRFGALADGPFQVTSGILFQEHAACVSSPILGTHRAMIVYQQDQKNDILVSAIDGTSILGSIDLSFVVNPATSMLHEIEPSIDCDGQHFVAAYCDPVPNGSAPYTVYASQLYLVGNQISIAEPHVLLHQFGLSERRPRVSATRSDDGMLHHRYFIAYDFEQNPTDHDIAGALFDTGEGGDSNTFCGNATGQMISCPCGLNGTLTNGCPNSANSAGAHLSVGGILSTLHDTAALTATGMPSNASCIFLQGTATNGGVVFGDGVRCTAGTLIRLAVKNASLGQATYPTGADQPLSVRGGVAAGGGMRAYQVWYRDNNLSFCTPQTFNISSGVLIDWAP